MNNLVKVSKVIVLWVKIVLEPESFMTKCLAKLDKTLRLLFTSVEITSTSYFNQKPN